jgi:uncharacterized glyoxalase superfamily protein PhnB
LLPLLVMAAAGAAAAYRPLHPAPKETAVTVRKLTPVLVVDRVEPAAAFWRERLGFEQQFEVPHGDAVGFVSLAQGDVEIMYQSRASVADDLPALAAGPHQTVLFIEVDDLDAVERAMAGVEIVSPRRTTFYGMHEIAVREPGGNVVVFAQPAEGQGQ